MLLAPVWLAGALAMSPVAPSLSAATLLRCREPLGLQAFVSGTGRCPAARACVGLLVHVVVEVDDRSVVEPAWFAAQVATANRLYAEVGVGFEVAQVRGEPARLARIETPAQRDALGRGAHDPGVVHVWVVRRLADIDIAGEEIRGVHWRDRADKTRRYIILSSISGDRVLAHELGHFFGLPHSSWPESIMNKSPRDEPPFELRSFHPSEYVIMRRRRDAMFRAGVLLRRDPGPPRSNSG